MPEFLNSFGIASHNSKQLKQNKWKRQQWGSYWIALQLEPGNEDFRISLTSCAITQDDEWNQTAKAKSKKKVHLLLTYFEAFCGQLNVQLHKIGQQNVQLHKIMNESKHLKQKACKKVHLLLTYFGAFCGQLNLPRPTECAIT